MRHPINGPIEGGTDLDNVMINNLHLGGDLLETSTNAADLTAKYGPIGLRAVASACLSHRKNACALSAPTRKIDTLLVARLSRVEEPSTQDSEQQFDE